MKRRLITLIMILALTASLLPAGLITAGAVQSCAGNYNTGYTITGNGADDIVAVAEAQLGLYKADLGYTEDWCADFIGDCAKLAGVDDLIPLYGGVSSLRSGIISAGADYWNYGVSDYVYNVQKGDILIVSDSSDGSYNHAGIVRSVSGDTIYCIDGNWSGKVSAVTRSRDNTQNKYYEEQKIVCVLRPQYKSFVAGSWNTDLTVQTLQDVTAMSEPSTSESYISGTLSSGTQLHATAIAMDNNGVYWYKVELSSGDSVYIKAAEAEQVSENWSVQVISASNPPAELTVGKSCNIGGVVETGGSLISKVQALVYSGEATEGTAVISSREETPNVTAYNLAGNVNYAIAFGSISEAGSYTYLVRATLTCYILNDSGVTADTYTLILPETVAQFTEVQSTCTVTFDPNGGTCDVTSLTPEAGGTVGLPEPTRSGYSFLGWYTAAEGGTLVTAETTFSSSTTLYAHWAEIQKDESCGANAYWHLEDGILTIYGSGAMTDFTGTDSIPWYDDISSITAIVVQDGITSIGNYAFCGCSSAASVSLPDGLRTIGGTAFAGCSGLTSVSFPSTLQTIGEQCFTGCNGLSEVILPEGLQTIGGQAFVGLSNLKTVYIPDSVTSIGDYAFAFAGMTQVTFAGRPAVGTGAFMNDTAKTYYTADAGWTADLRTACGDRLVWTLIGDANGSGSLTLQDVSLLFRILTGKTAYSGDELIPDVTMDGTFELRDVAAAYEMVS